MTENKLLEKLEALQVRVGSDNELVKFSTEVVNVILELRNELESLQLEVWNA